MLIGTDGGEGELLWVFGSFFRGWGGRGGRGAVDGEGRDTTARMGVGKKALSRFAASDVYSQAVAYCEKNSPAPLYLSPE